MYKYCLFDLDGTLTDPKEGICKSAQYGLHKMGIEEPDINKLEPFIGPPLIDSYMDFYNMSKEDALKAVEFYRERFSVVGLYENEIYPGMADLLKNLNNKGIKLAIASSKPTVFVEKILEHFKIKKYFTSIVGSELDGTRNKKSEVINEALSQLLSIKNTGEKIQIDKATKSQIVMIGDRKFDIEGAKEFDVDSIGVSYGYGGKYELKKAGATYIAATVEELGNLLLPEMEQKKNNDFAEQPLPQLAIFRASYALVPFALFYCIMLAVESIGKIVFEWSARNNMTQIVDLVQNNSELVAGYMLGIAMLVAGIVVFLIYKRTDPFKIGVDLKLIMPALAGVLLGVGLNIFFGFITMKFPALAPDSPNSAKAVPLFVGILIFVLISPVVEEIVFRYLVYGRMRRFMGVFPSALISALFFGIYHNNIIQGIYAFIMGFIMALLYEWSGNILSNMLFHFGANAITFGLMNTNLDLSMTNTIILCVVTIILGSVIVAFSNKKRIKK